MLLYANIAHQLLLWQMTRALGKWCGKPYRFSHKAAEVIRVSEHTSYQHVQPSPAVPSELHSHLYQHRFCQLLYCVVPHTQNEINVIVACEQQFHYLSLLRASWGVSSSNLSDSLFPRNASWSNCGLCSPLRCSATVSWWSKSRLGQYLEDIKSENITDNTTSS